MFKVIVIGGGPIGIAAAAHLSLSESRFLLLERGSEVGSNIRDWGHVRLFSPWKYNLDSAAKKILAQHGIKLPDENGLPTGHQLIDQYLSPVASVPGIHEYILLNSDVISVGRKHLDKSKTTGRSKRNFEVRINRQGKTQSYESEFVIDATGTWSNPNPLGGGGYWATGESENSDRINYSIPDISGSDRKRYSNKNVLVIGSGHSAINSALDLCRLKASYPQTTPHWIMRKQSLASIFGGRDADELEARGKLGIEIEQRINSNQIKVHYPVQVSSVSQFDSSLTIIGTKCNEPFVLPDIDEIIVNTGSRPDFSFLRETHFQVDNSLECVPALAPLIDPNLHSCGTVPAHGESTLRQPEENFYVVGGKSYGRAPTFLMAVGYEQVRSIVAYINGDEAASKRVELKLPQTGVCSSSLTAEQSNCCS